MNRIVFVVREAGGSSYPFDFEVKRLWNGGWAARDSESLRAHIAELERIGVAIPTSTPIFFPLSSTLATTSSTVEVLGGQTSGEVEYALLFQGDDIFVTVASDHTDRGLERHGIQASKQLYSNVLASEVWPYRECRSHWDALVIRCWTTKEGHRRVYQEAQLSELLSADAWLDRLQDAGVLTQGLIFLSGTPPARGDLTFADTYDLELEDPVLRRTIRHRYQVEVLGPGKQ